MHTILKMLGGVALVLWPAMGWAQKADQPTRRAAVSTAEEETAIGSGVALHDQGKYAAAIVVYEDVLRKNPDNTKALYELAYSFIENKDYAKSIEAANRGTTYQSDILPRFYDLLGSTYDLMGDPLKAIDAYKRGIAVVPDDSNLYFNMAVTYFESLKNSDEARRALKQAVAIDPVQPSIHLMLGQVFQTRGSPTPALFAFATYLVLAPNTSQSLQAYGFLRLILRGGMDGGPRAAMSMGAERVMRPTDRPPAPPTDEGDFRDFETQIASSHLALLEQLDADVPEIEALVGQVERLLTVLAARGPDRDRGTFVATQYLPYFLELKAKGYVEPFVYWAVQRAPIQGVREWLTGNQGRVKEFLDWTRSYPWKRS